MAARTRAPESNGQSGAGGCWSRPGTQGPCRIRPVGSGVPFLSSQQTNGQFHYCPMHAGMHAPPPFGPVACGFMSFVLDLMNYPCSLCSKHMCQVSATLASRYMNGEAQRRATFSTDRATSYYFPLRHTAIHSIYSLLNLFILALRSD